MFHILLKSHTQNYHPTSLRKRIAGCPTTLLKYPQNKVICIEKGVPNNFAQVTTILKYWAICIGNIY